MKTLRGALNQHLSLSLYVYNFPPISNLTLRMRLPFFLLCTLCFYQTTAQGLLKIKVVDSNLHPVPNCSVTWNKMLGLVTNENGEVTIDNTEQVKDSIVISTIGYEKKVLYRNEVAGKNFLQVQLNEMSVVLPEVRVGNRQNIYSLGCTERKEGYSYLTNRGPSTMQVGYLVDGYPRDSYLEEFSVFIAKKSDKQIPFRIRIYGIDHGIPGSDLTNKDVIINEYETDKWNSFRLDSLNLGVPDNGFFVAVEWLVTNSLKNDHLGVGQTDSMKSENTYVRWGNVGWKKFTPPSPINKNPTNVMFQVKLSTF